MVVSEVTTRSVSMKLRQTSVLKRRQQNIKDLRKEKSRNGTFQKNAGSTCTEISSVLLSSDTDSSQSDENVVDLSVGNRRRIEEEKTHTFVKSQANSSGTGPKISLALSAVAEDTLGKLRLLSNNTKPEARSSSPLESEREDIEECESALDESSEYTVQSGPSSPNPDVNTVRCRECESLFSKMKRQTPSKLKNRGKSKHLSLEKLGFDVCVCVDCECLFLYVIDPASLSCDQWVLLKKWHPQRCRHRKKGYVRSQWYSKHIIIVLFVIEMATFTRKTKIPKK